MLAGAEPWIKAAVVAERERCAKIAESGIRAAIAAERERCAKIAEADGKYGTCGYAIALKIRSNQ